MLRKILGSRRDDGAGDDYIMRSLMTYTRHKIIGRVIK
jgi:hypothetical protein